MTFLPYTTRVYDEAVMLRTWADRRSLWALWPAPAAWVLGILLSAPAWLMVLEFIPYAARARNGSGLPTSTGIANAGSPARHR